MAIVVLLSSGVAAWSERAPSAAPSGPVPAGPGAAGAAELTRAVQTLATGLGPAAGHPTACSPPRGGVASCGLAVAGTSPAVTTGAVWTDASAIQSNWPTNRTLGALVWDGADDYVLLFGGCSSASTCNGVELGDTWAFANNQWENLTPSLSLAPSGRAIPQIAYDAADSEVVLFGGLIGNAASVSGSLNDTWTYAHGVWKNLSSSLARAPVPRYRGAMTYDAADGYVLLFGGTASSASTVPYKDTWKFVNNTWTDLTTTVTGSPPGRYRASVAYDAADREVVLFGGCLSSTNCPTSNTWTYSGGTWTNLTSTLTKAPAGRVYPAMTYDARDGYVLLFGGSHTTTSGPIFGDTWKFVNNTWTNLTAALKTAPPQAAQGMLAFDGADNQTLYFGGYNALGSTTNGYGATWVYGPPIVGYASVAPAHVDVGQTVLVSVAAASDFRPLGFSYTQLPSACASANASTLSCAPGAPYAGNLTISVNDTHQDTVNYSAPLVVVPDPAIVSFSESVTNVTVGSAVNFTVNATGGTTPYRYAYHALPSGCASANSANLTCVPRGSGNTTVVVQVTDAVGFSVTAQQNLTVHPTPTILNFTASVVTTDVGFPIAFGTNVSGGTPPLHYAYSGLPAGCAAANAAQLTCRPTAPGQTTVQVNVTDAFGWYATATVSVTVNADVRIDSAAVAIASIDAGTPFTLWVNASGGTAPLGYRYTGLPVGCALNGSSTGTCRPTVPGNYSIVANVTDAVGDSATMTLALVIVPDPSITAFTATPGTTDVGIATTLAVAVSNGTPSFVFVYHNLPPGCPTNDSAALRCAPNAPGHYSVSVTATDAFGKTTTSSVALAVNPDVRITTFNDSVPSVTVGQPVSFAVVASGGTGALGYTYAGLPTGCSSANASTLTCSPTLTGTFDVVVNVRDALGSAARDNLTLLVAPAPTSSSGPLGISGASGTYLLVALAVAVIAAVAVGLLWARRRRAPPQPAEPEPEAEPEPATPPPWDER